MDYRPERIIRLHPLEPSVAANEITETWDESEAGAIALPLHSQVLPSETPNVQIATLSTPDPAPTDTKEAPDSGQRG